jgi:hypothetical protein
LYIKVVSFAFQPNFPDVDIPEGDRDLLPIDTASSQALEIAPKLEVLDHCAEHLSRIAVLKGLVKVLKQQMDYQWGNLDIKIFPTSNGLPRPMMLVSPRSARVHRGP